MVDIFFVAPMLDNNLVKNKKGKSDGKTEIKNKSRPLVMLFIYLVGCITKRTMATIIRKLTIVIKILLITSVFCLREKHIFDILLLGDIINYMSKIKSGMKKEKIKIALALGSGGAKGIAHIGVLKALKEMGIKIDIITGSSMGAIVGACYAMGVPVEDMEKRALEITNGDIMDFKFPNAYGFIKGNKAEKVIRKLIGFESDEPVFSDCLIPFGCVASDISRAELVKITSGRLIPAVRASFSVCGVFRPVELNKRKLLDGGIYCRVPVDLAKDLGADYVIGVDCIGQTLPEDIDNYKYVDTITRIFNIMDYQVSKPEMDRADTLISLYQPMVSSARIKNIEEGIEIGYKTTLKALPKIVKDIVALNKKLTKGE